MKNNNDLPARALAFAEAVHAGQLRHDGEPYIEHVKRVAAAFSDPIDVACALLHDCIEDGPDDVAHRMHAEFGSAIFGTVLLASRLPQESYAEYIRFVKHDDRARRIKLADLADNLNGCPDSLRKRYLRAQAILEAA